MSGTITGIHLQVCDNLKIADEVNKFAAWIITSAFGPYKAGLEKCVDSERVGRILPLLTALGFENEVRKLQIQLKRTVSNLR
jgi:hypothetical protein